MKNKHRKVLGLFLLAIFVHICAGMEVYGGQAEEFDPSMNGYVYYEKYGDDTVFNAVNNCITFANFEKRDGVSPPTGYWQWGLRYIIRNTGYYIDIRSDAGMSEALRYSVYERNGYEYYKYELELQKMIDLYSAAYPSVDFGKYFKDGYTVDIVALMGVRKNNIYTCYDDLTEDGKGRFKSAKASADGASPYTNLYTNEADMRKAYYDISGMRVRFDIWYNHSVRIVPKNPRTDNYTIRAGTPVISGISSDLLYRINDNSYYVMADVPFTLSFDSVTLINGEVAANATYQPERNALVSYARPGSLPMASPMALYHYISSPKGAYVDSAVYSTFFPNGCLPPYGIKGYSQRRSGDMTTLTSHFTFSVPETDANNHGTWCVDLHRFYGRGEAKLKDITKSANSPSYVSIIGDKTPPEPVSCNSYGWYNRNVGLTFMASDALSGLRNFELYEGNGTTLLQTAEFSGGAGSICRTFTDEGTISYILKASDNVSNTFTKMITVKIDKTPPDIDTGVIEEVYDDDVELTFKASDTHSGMSDLTLKSGDGSIIAEGTDVITNIFKEKGINTYILEASDIAGNVNRTEITVAVKKATKKSYRVVGTH